MLVQCRKHPPQDREPERQEVPNSERRHPITSLLGVSQKGTSRDNGHIRVSPGEAEE